MLRYMGIALLFALGVDTGRTPLATCFPENVPQMLNNGKDPGEPLFLTPYIEKGQIEEARKLSKVGPLNGTSLKSYSGFLTVNKKYNSNMFFWFFPSQRNSKVDPVLLWLQGGPGGTSLFGLFYEHGPFFVDKTIHLRPRNVTWNSYYSMLYIDNPVGTGFSFTDHDAGYARTETDVANDLYEALQQFFTVFHDYRKLDFYLTGESYAGKYVPAIGYKIDQENPSAKLYINLKGIAIGDGLCDPETMLGGYADLLHQIGMADELQRDYFHMRSDKAINMIRRELYKDAFEIFDSLLNGDLTPYPSYFYNISGSTNYFNYLMTTSSPDENNFYQYLALPEVRKAIHVGGLPFNNGTIVEKHLMEDMMQSVKPWVTHLMNNYRVLMYSGQLDIIVGATLTQRFLWTLDWDHAVDYRQTKRFYWKVNPEDIEVAGYVRHVNDFYQVIIRGGGHMLPADQPERTLDMLNRFITKTF